jgi:16S rRNA (cytidine1402-2'-O)-methyltransferase
MGIFYVIATPIGNLKDITIRALEILRTADLILAEDTRVTKKLLAHYEIRKPVFRCDEYSTEKIQNEVKQRVAKGEKIALVSDAGTPTIADPGSRLIDLLHKEKIKVVPVPGPSALTAAISVSGFRGDQFTFLGYPPHKKGREKFFSSIKDIKTKPIVLYESVHRLKKTLNSLIEILGPDQEIAICRELTKIYEEIFLGKIDEADKYFDGEHLRGEFVLVIP